MKIEDVKEYLTDQGFRPSIDQDGDLQFKYEGGRYFIEAKEKDEMFIRIVFPNFWEIETPEEKIKCYEAANSVSRGVKVVKVFVVDFKDGSNVWASVELFLPDLEAFKVVFLRSIRLLSSIPVDFSDFMKGKE